MHKEDFKSGTEFNFGLVGILLYPQHSRKKQQRKTFFPVQLLLFDMVAFILLYFQKEKENQLYIVLRFSAP